MTAWHRVKSDSGISLVRKYFLTDRYQDIYGIDKTGSAVPMVHPAGTCAIGRATDSQAVLDSTCRVYGVANLRVVDASVMPQIPSANTNLPTLMVAERAAELIKKGE